MCRVVDGHDASARDGRHSRLWRRRRSDLAPVESASNQLVESLGVLEIELRNTLTVVGPHLNSKFAVSKRQQCVMIETFGEVHLVVHERRATSIVRRVHLADQMSFDEGPRRMTRQPLV